MTWFVNVSNNYVVTLTRYIDDMTATYTFFWKIGQDYGEFSQWYQRDVIVNGITYNCAEQYYMAEKARLFKDTVSLALIMSETSPAAQQRIGRRVTKFDNGTWLSHQMTVLYNVNLAKFTQSVGLAKTLLSTGDSVIAEASPYDSLCGIGYDKVNAIDNVNRWGQNRLGTVLMAVRSHLRQFRKKTIDVWTDGSCTGNGTPAAKCGIGVYYGIGDPRNTSGSLLHGRITNNRAELSAIMYVLCTNIGSDDINIHTDSLYSIQCITGYSKRWVDNGWLTTAGKPVESADMIRYILMLMSLRSSSGGSTKFVHVKAHSTNVNNNAADALARVATAGVVIDRKAEFMIRRCKVPL